MERVFPSFRLMTAKLKAGGRFLRSPDTYWYGVGMLGLAALLVLMFVAAFLVIPRIAFRSDPKFQDEYSLDFSPEGIHFRTDHIDSQLQWSLYSKALIDVYSFVLYYGTRSFTVIPNESLNAPNRKQRSKRCLCTTFRRS